MNFVDELFGSFRKQPSAKSGSDPLPNAILLKQGYAQYEIFRALSINTFLLEAKTAESKGAKVVYDAATKTANIYHTNGSVSQIKHD